MENENMIREPPKLRRVRRLDSIKLDAKDSTYFTDEGYLVDHPILTSVGIFEYTNPDGSTRRELRLPEHVFDKDSLKTYKGKPVIITHKAGVVNKDNVDQEQIGTIMSEGYQDGDDVRAEIIIHNTDAMKASGLKELSLGYNLDLVEEPGVWNGEPYDAIQTNIVINHLALVASARAGEQARLNIDGSDEPELKGGKAMAKVTSSRRDGGDLSPDEVKKGVGALRSEKENGAPAKEDDAVTPAPAENPNAGEKPAQKKDGNAEAVALLKKLIVMLGGNTDGADDEDPEAEDPKQLFPGAEEPTKKDCSGKQKKDCSGKDCGGKTDGDDPDEDPQKDEDDPKEPVKKDSSDDESKSLNADSADDIFKQRLSICRVGDKLNMDGLDNMSIRDGKRAIIRRVLPDMRLDGKDAAYIDAMYDIAVSQVNKRKDVDFQRMQMAAGGSSRRNDGRENSAASARQRMIERMEGGNE